MEQTKLLAEALAHNSVVTVDTFLTLLELTFEERLLRTVDADPQALAAEQAVLRMLRTLHTSITRPRTYA